MSLIFSRTIDFATTDDFIKWMKQEEVQPITLMPRPPKGNQLKEDTLLNGHFQTYCNKHEIIYYFQKEDASQTHYHGLMRFPTKKVRTNFVKWYNRAYGKFYASDKADCEGWYKYVHKDIPEEEYVEVLPEF